MAGRRRGALSAAATAGLLALLGVLLPSSAGWAQDGVVSSRPANQAALANAPEQVDLTFSAVPDVSESHVTVQTGSGSAVNAGPLDRLGRSGLRQPVRITATGDFAVAYHVVFIDGTDVAGVLRFSVGTGVAPAGDAAAAGHDHGVDPVGAVLLLADVVVLVGVVVMLRRRPGPPSAPPGAAHVADR